MLCICNNGWLWGKKEKIKIPVTANVLANVNVPEIPIVGLEVHNLINGIYLLS